MNISAHRPTIQPKAYQPSSRQTESSPTGKILAETNADAYDSSRGNWRGDRLLAADGLRFIRDNENVTADEKSLAILGLKMGGRKLYNESGAKIQRAVIGVIAAAVPGPVGMVLAQTTLDASNAASSTMSWSHERGVSSEGLKAVLSNESTSAGEKSLAALGLSLSGDSHHNQDATSMNKLVLKTIAKGASGKLPQVLAETTLQAYSKIEVGDWDKNSKVESRGLEAVRDHADSTEYDKTIAALGLKFGAGSITSEDSAKFKKTVLQALADPKQGSLPFEIAQVTKSAYKAGTRHKASRKVLRDGFEAILSRTDVSETQKALAQMGIDAGAGEISNVVAVRRRATILDKLISLG